METPVGQRVVAAQIERLMAMPDEETNDRANIIRAITGGQFDRLNDLEDRREQALTVTTEALFGDWGDSAWQAMTKMRRALYDIRSLMTN